MHAAQQRAFGTVCLAKESESALDLFHQPDADARQTQVDGAASFRLPLM